MCRRMTRRPHVTMEELSDEMTVWGERNRSAFGLEMLSILKGAAPELGREAGSVASSPCPSPAQATERRAKIQRTHSTSTPRVTNPTVGIANGQDHKNLLQRLREAWR